MQVSAEIRWFWRDLPPDGLADWFREGGSTYCSAGGGQNREDRYLKDAGQIELGIKLRGGKPSKPGVEVKGLVAAESGVLEADPFRGTVQLWTKWSSRALELGSDSTVAVRKRRWLRKFAAGAGSLTEIPLGADENPIHGQFPDRGCNVEWTEIQPLAGSTSVWWTLGFESFSTLKTVEGDLRAAANALAARNPPDLTSGILASYPEWLAELAK